MTFPLLVPYPGIRVVPAGVEPLSVTITNPASVNASAFSDPYGVTPVSFPVSITTPTTFYISGEGPWLVNGQTVVLEGNQVATVDFSGVNLSPPRLGGTTHKPASVPYYNAYDFGAVGNGVADDTAALNATLAAAVARPGWVVWPKGNFKTTAPVAPPVLVNGLRIIGDGVGESVIQFNPTIGYGGAIQNIGDDTFWIIEGIEIDGPGTGNVVGAQLLAGQVWSANFGVGVLGFYMQFLTDSIIRSCKCTGLTAGVVDFSGAFNDWDVHTVINRNVGTVLLQSTGAVIRGINQTSGGNVSATSEVVANILLANINTSAGGPIGTRIAVGYIDELQDLNTNFGGASLHIAAATDTTVEAKQVYTPGKKQSGQNPFYGIRVGPNATRTLIRGTRIQPFTVDATRVPTNTILIESGATDTILEDVSTNPNAANGGGDLSDSGTRTVYRNVVLNGAPALYTTPPAGTVTVATNAGTVSAAAAVSNFTNSSAATMTITMSTTGAVDGQTSIVRVYDFSAASQTISWVNTENSGVSAPTSSAGSTTSPKTVTFQYNGATSKWRCIESV